MLECQLGLIFFILTFISQFCITICFTFLRVICFRISYVFVPITFCQFRLYTRTLWRVLRFLYLEQQHHYNLTNIKHIQRRFLKTLEQI